jgi:hypothetical protein
MQKKVFILLVLSVTMGLDVYGQTFEFTGLEVLGVNERDTNLKASSAVTKAAKLGWVDADGAMTAAMTREDSIAFWAFFDENMPGAIEKYRSSEGLASVDTYSLVFVFVAKQNGIPRYRGLIQLWTAGSDSWLCDYFYKE